MLAFRMPQDQDAAVEYDATPVLAPCQKSVCLPDQWLAIPHTAQKIAGYGRDTMCRSPDVAADLFSLYPFG